MADKHKKTFYLHDGKTFSNLKGLAKVLKDMPEHVYKHHVNKNRNDFANWVKHSLKKEDLAKKINGELNKIELELHVLRHLLFEEGKKTQSKKGKKSKSKK